MTEDRAVPTRDRWLAALRKGTVLASRCPRCGRVWLPPRPICPIDHAVPRWVEIDGAGTIDLVVRVEASGRHPAWTCARARMDGADTHLTGRLDAPDADSIQAGARVRVAAVAPEDGQRTAETESTATAWRFVLADD